MRMSLLKTKLRVMIKNEITVFILECLEFKIKIRMSQRPIAERRG